jgi:adenylate kinase
VRVVVTGTPGTGKTTATDHLDETVVHLNDAVRERARGDTTADAAASETDDGLVTGRDDERDSLIVDVDAAADFVDERAAATDGPVVVESHLAHRLPADRVVVLRCRPDVLEDRLVERGESPASATENRESEALDVVAGEAVERHGREAIYEIETTEATPTETAAAIEQVVAGEREPAVGTVEYLEYV